MFSLLFLLTSLVDLPAPLGEPTAVYFAAAILGGVTGLVSRCGTRENPGSFSVTCVSLLIFLLRKSSEPSRVLLALCLPWGAGLGWAFLLVLLFLLG